MTRVLTVFNRLCSFPDRYAYAEASFPQMEGNSAILRSPRVLSTGPACMVLYANTFGRAGQRGNLSIKFHVAEKSGWKYYVKDLTGTEDRNVWTIHKIELPRQRPFSVRPFGCLVCH